MSHFGGLTAGIERYGGRKPRVEMLLASLNSQHGTAFDVAYPSPIYIKNLAIAKCISDVWDTAERMGNQFIWEKVSEFIPRWERIFGLHPSASESDKSRRDTIAARWNVYGRLTTHQALIDAIDPLLGGVTYSIVNQDYTNADFAWPYGAGAVQNVDAGPTVTASGQPTYSTVPSTIHWTIDGAGVLGVATFTWSIDGVTQASAVVTGAAVVLAGTGLTLAFSAGAYVAQRYIVTVHSDLWSSTVMRIGIVVPKPSTMPESVYQKKMSAVKARADEVLPAWVDTNFIRDSSTLGTGFYLDQPFNLDCMRFV